VNDNEFNIHYQPLFSVLQLMDVQSLIDQVTDPWYNQTLIQVGDVVVRLGVMQGEFIWHKHYDQDEFFFLLDGVFRIELEKRRAGRAAPAPGLHGPSRNAAPPGRPGPQRGPHARESRSSSDRRLTSPGTPLTDRDQTGVNRAISAPTRDRQPGEK